MEPPPGGPTIRRIIPEGSPHRNVDPIGYSDPSGDRRTAGLFVSSTLLTALAKSSGRTPPFVSCKCPMHSETIRASELRVATGLSAEASAAQLT
jgi:hypothetical protein